ncbi:tetratricopeptide repeat protein 15 [Aphelenchoides avenae]|nr:tetratricopeptide repeat protein 15 [Aphelenchus avenae]
MDTSTQNEKAAVLEALVRIYVYIGDEKGLERSLKPVFYGNFPQAEEQFKSLRDKDVSVAINNEAVCKLYNGKLDEAVKLLTHVTGPPAEPSLLNWSTIVDLSSTNSKELKKHHLISLCDKLSDVFDPQVLKVQ